MKQRDGPSSEAAAIIARGLTRTFPGGVAAVNGLDLEVADGEIYAFLGPNGAGKTTTVRILTTLLRPSSGSATVAGFDVTSEAPSVRRSIGVALQDAALDGLMTATELVDLQASLYDVPDRVARPRAAVLFEQLGLTDVARRRVATYSGGMKRRLDLALALLHEPSILFLDEPTTGLDLPSRRTIWEEVMRLNQRGTTIFLTTQYLEEADRIAHRVGIIDRGTLVAEGTPAELKSRIVATHVDVRVVEHDVEAATRILGRFGSVAHGDEGGLSVSVPDGRRELPGIVQALTDADLTVESVEVTRPTLDDVFLAVTGREPHEDEGSRGVTEREDDAISIPTADAAP